MLCLAGYSLYKTYTDIGQEIRVLQGTNLEVECGDFVCITGKSGCGKSTLLHILGLLDEPDSGKILIKGQEVSTHHPQANQIRNQQIGFVFQFHYLIDDLNARENVVLPRLIAGTNKSIAYQKADELLHLMELSDRALHYPNQLSGGEQQRVNLARALLLPCHILLLDEPLNGIEDSLKKRLIKFTEDWTASYKPLILWATHLEVATYLKGDVSEVRVSR